MKLAIFGASGATGTHLVQQAMASGHLVTAFTRDLKKLKYQHPALKVVTGDVRDFEAVQQAISGQDAVLSALGAHSMFKLDKAVNDGISNILIAMTASNVNRLIYLSTQAVAATRNQAGFMIAMLAPTLLRTEIAGHETREKLIQHSSLQWSIVRAPMLTNGQFTGRYRSGLNLRSTQFVTRLSRADVANYMVSTLSDDQSFRKCLMIMPKISG